MFTVTSIRLWSQIRGEEYLTLPTASICKAGAGQEGWHPGTESKKNSKNYRLPLASWESIKTCLEKGAFVKVCEDTETVAGPSPLYETNQPTTNFTGPLALLYTRCGFSCIFIAAGHSWGPSVSSFCT